MRNLTKPFQGSRIRLQTAFNQTLALSVALSKYAESGPFRPIVVNGGFSIRPIVTPPDWIAELLTAAIHSCRTSLDLLACDLVRLNNKSAKGVHFPFAENAEELDGQIKRKHFDRATPDVVELLRSFKPFKGGNLLLRAMHDIDVATKHDTILQISVFPP
ncbi:hypothetical protein [Mesorhizobium sp.]|uniref:hypothetical protein n=1 Tax=Mesorhizobium sp. TaxID=1871066 RepID=UPI000FE95801|nr:hypothetical protein [Mesorhizobium sp.]RWD85114.1 MAG: hypothetical protein EOS48_03130 [Mesorhizobium sp.]TIS36379.1 MAG: hypothetical protein E5W95_23410 [Mesorhizobium sp.]TIX86201.1 MAG: hypothetical protein E5V21_01765 [Mesorhizobium sp.]